MKLLVVGILCCGFLLISAHADEKPIYEFPEWWSVRDFSLRVESRVRGGKIIGGREATQNQFPYHVGLLLFIKDSNEVGFCSGAMLSPTRVVTVAHCVDVVVGVEAVFGTHFINRVETAQIRRRVQLADIAWHENYNPRNLTNDVAIINLRTPVATSSVVQVVSLPEDDDLTNDFAGKLAVVTGWGRFSQAPVLSKALRFVEVKVITNEMCRKRFPTMIHNSTICTSGTRPGGGNVGTCNSDSGGPLVIQRNGTTLLIGLTSFVSGVSCDAGFPTGFIRATSFASWIRERMQ